MPPSPSHLTPPSPSKQSPDPFNPTWTHLYFHLPISILTVSTLSLGLPHISHALLHQPPNWTSCLQICPLKSALHLPAGVPLKCKQHEPLQSSGQSINRCSLHQNCFMIKLCFPMPFPFSKHPIPGTLCCIQHTNDLYILKIPGSSLDLYTPCSLFLGCPLPPTPLSTTLLSHHLLTPTLSFKIYLGHQLFQESLPVLFLVLLVGTTSNNVKNNNEIITIVAAVICFTCQHNVMPLHVLPHLILTASL